VVDSKVILSRAVLAANFSPGGDDLFPSTTATPDECKGLELQYGWYGRPLRLQARAAAVSRARLRVLATVDS